jgi:hypothetical protein
VHLCSWMPFERAVQMMECLLGVQVSEATARRQTEQAGALAQAVQTQQAQAKEQESSPDGQAGRLALSADGAYVPLIGGRWAEVRTVAIGEVEPERPTGAEQEVHVGHLSYFSRMSDAETFADLAEVEMRRRGVSRAQEICAVTDGADWLQGFLDLHCPDAVRILDFPHAVEHLNLLLQAISQAGMDLPTDLLPRLCHRLKHRGPRLLLRLLARLPAPLREQEGVREHLSYLCKREAVMQYPRYREQGWPLGSGMVESANKLVVQTRLKGAGMHWAPSQVNPMLTLRNAVCNERWQECWQQICTEQSHKRLLRRKQKAVAHFQQLISSLLLLRLRFHPATSQPVAPAPRPVVPAATLPGSSRPSAHHPWKQHPICRPKPSAKT